MNTYYEYITFVFLDEITHFLCVCHLYLEWLNKNKQIHSLERFTKQNLISNIWIWLHIFTIIIVLSLAFWNR